MTALFLFYYISHNPRRLQQVVHYSNKVGKLRFVPLCVCVPGERMDAQVQVVDRLRSTFRSGITVPEQFRRSQLTKLMSLIKENEELILNALHKDLAKVGLLM